MPFGTIARWISGDDPNKEARAAEREQQKNLNSQASQTNQYNRNVYLTDKKNYEEESKYAFETAITNWEYGKKIQDYQYAQSLAVYEKSHDIYEGQLNYNEQAADRAVSDQEAGLQDIILSQAFQREAQKSDLKNQIQLQRSDLTTKLQAEGLNVANEIKSAAIGKVEQKVKLSGIESNRRFGSEAIQQTLNEITTKNSFDKEAKFIESLQKGGKAALGQAGVSRAKGLQSTAASAFRDLVALDSSLSGSRNKAAVDLLKLQVDSSIEETQIGLNLDRLQLGESIARQRYKQNVSSAMERTEIQINAAKDEARYNSQILNANMRSAIDQMGRNIQQIELQKQGADLQAQANLNLFPEEFDYAPEPQMPPKRRFVEPLEFDAPTVPKGPRVSTGIDSVFEVVGGLADIAGTVMGGIGTFNNIFNKAPSLGGGFDAGKTVLGAGGGSVGGVGTFGPNFGFPSSN